MFVLPVKPIPERAAVLAVVAASDEPWHLTAELIDQSGSALDLITGKWTAFDPGDIDRARKLVSENPLAEIARYSQLIESLARDDIEVVTVLDQEYPNNLHTIYNRPPMLFVRGPLIKEDEKAVAVVVTRRPSPDGLVQARRLATELAHARVTVLSGLARGIDTAAHQAAL